MDTCINKMKLNHDQVANLVSHICWLVDERINNNQRDRESTPANEAEVELTNFLNELFENEPAS